MSHVEGPAHLALREGVAHKKRACPDYQAARVQAEAAPGECHGFTWCEKCGSGTFFPAGENCELCGMIDGKGKFHYCPYEGSAKSPTAQGDGAGE
jgi:hypothetical protein